MRERCVALECRGQQRGCSGQEHIRAELERAEGAVGVEGGRERAHGALREVGALEAAQPAALRREQRREEELRGAGLAEGARGGVELLEVRVVLAERAGQPLQRRTRLRSRRRVLLGLVSRHSRRVQGIRRLQSGGHAGGARAGFGAGLVVGDKHESFHVQRRVPEAREERRSRMQIILELEARIESRVQGWWRDLEELGERLDCPRARAAAQRHQLDERRARGDGFHDARLGDRLTARNIEMLAPSTHPVLHQPEQVGAGHVRPTKPESQVTLEGLVAQLLQRRRRGGTREQVCGDQLPADE
eukprot:scaffold5137_cov67-Phaeocystis_antarctica.AAC.1